MEIYKIVLFFSVLFAVVFAVRFFEEMVPGRYYGKMRLSGYRLRHRVMNDSEAAFFLMLTKELSPNHHVFPKMRIADILDTKDGEGYFNRRNKILPKHIDFLVCDAYFQPIVGIEIDGKSHNSFDRIERDKFKDDVFKGVGLEFIRVKVGSDFRGAVEAIVQKCKN